MAKKYGLIIQWAAQNNPKDRSGMLIEQLRYAQLVSVDEAIDGSMKLTIWSPLERGSNHEQWQKNNIARMKTFGVHASPIVVNR